MLYEDKFTVKCSRQNMNVSTVRCYREETKPRESSLQQTQLHHDQINTCQRCYIWQHTHTTTTANWPQIKHNLPRYSH